MSQARRFPPYPKKSHSSGQARIKINGKPVYLGKHGSPESWAQYRRCLAEWERGQPVTSRRSGSVRTVKEVVSAYLVHARDYYVKDGKSTGQLERITRSLGFARNLYGERPIEDFDQASLELVRSEMIAADYSRGHVNQCISCVRRCWKWAAARKMIPLEFYQALTLLEDLKRGRSTAREMPPVRPAPIADVEKTIPFLLPPVGALVRLQLLTGMRPGEALSMRLCDIDRSGAVWVYTPEHHKNEHRDMVRTIFLGPQAQEVIRPYLAVPIFADDVVRPRGEEEYLFRPSDAMEWKARQRRAARKTKVYNCEAKRRKADPQRAPKDQYDRRAYDRATARACEAAGVPHWHPNQLRHTAATRFRAAFGPDFARAALGHRSLQATSIYAEIDGDRVAEAMKKIG